MNTRFTQRSFASLAAIGMAIALASATPADRLDIVRGGTAGTDYGAFILGHTLNTTATSATNTYRDAGSFAISPNKQSGIDGDELFVGGVSDGAFDNVTGSPIQGKNDLIGFQIVQDPSVPDSIDVTRKVVANAEGGSGILAAIAVGGVANDGSISMRVDLGSGGLSQSGLISATSGSTSVFTTLGSHPAGYTPLAERLSSLTGNTMQIPAIGASSLITLTATFNKEIVVGGSSLPGTLSTVYTPKAKVLATILSTDPEDNRGSISYNEASGIAAVYRLTQTGTSGSTAIKHVTGVALYKVNILPSGDVELLNPMTNLATVKGYYVAFPTAVKTVGGKSYDLMGTNFFGTSAFSGPAQISINDNGDIAVLTVAADKTNTTDNQERGAQDKRYLVALNSASYASWTTVAQSGTNSSVTEPDGDIINTPGTGDFVTLNPLDDPANLLNSVAAGTPNIDNDGNVYFTAAYEVDYIVSTDPLHPFSTVKTAVYRAVPGSGVTRVIAEGDVLTDPNDFSERTVTFLPLAVATSNLGNGNIRFPARNSLSAAAAVKDSLGGLTVALKLTNPDNSDVPTEWSFLYLANRNSEQQSRPRNR